MSYFFLLSDSLSFILFRSHSSHSLRLDHVSHATPLLHGIYYFTLFCFNILIELKKVLINPAIQFQQDDIFYILYYFWFDATTRDWLTTYSK